MHSHLYWQPSSHLAPWSYGAPLYTQCAATEEHGALGDDHAQLFVIICIGVRCIGFYRTQACIFAVIEIGKIHGRVILIYK